MREGTAELLSALPKSLLLMLARGVGAGRAPEAEEERDRVVRCLGCLPAVPRPLALL